MESKMQNTILIYQQDDHDIEVQLDTVQETLWLNLNQISDLFGRDKSVVSRHLRNIYKEGELNKNATVAKNATVQEEGGRKVTRQVEYFNLDAIISVGYRVNSKKGTQFRIWATNRLKEYLIQGYSFDSKRFQKNAKELNAALELIKKTAQSPELNAKSGRGLVEIVSRYTQTFLWLQAYDEGLLDEPQGQEGGKLPTEQQAEAGLAELKQNLMAKGEATELFANPRSDGLGSILGNLQQTVFGEPAYPSIESKAAHLLYFMVKNHPFSDGNKRSGAFLFVDFLHRNNRLFNSDGETVINDTGLAALTLLVAESDPKQKETMIRLIMNMLSQEHNS
jgi:prophage maintenance system killer protein